MRDTQNRVFSFTGEKCLRITNHFFVRLLFCGSINDAISVLGDCHVLSDQVICFESSDG